MRKNKPQIILHQFPISHFCEKVRLTLHIKGLEFEVKNHLPLLHVLTVRRLSGQPMVPVLQCDGQIISDSNAIMKFLDGAHAQSALYPKTSKELHILGEFIQKIDVGVGVHLRRFFYHKIFPHRQLFCNLVAGSDYSLPERVCFKIISPLAVILMRRGLKITPRTAERSKTILLQTLDDLDGKISKKRFFFGNKLSAADITVAALLAPLVLPPEHPMDWPSQLPQELKQFRQQNLNRPVCQWVGKFYQNL